MSVETALLEANEAGAAAIWRSARRELAGPLRLGVLARDATVASRLAAHLADGPWQVVPRQVTASSLGLLDDLLGLHALIWATPAHAPLPAAERELLDQLQTAPELRGVVLADQDLLERISDDPETEAAQISARLGRLLPADWPLLDQLEPTEDLRARRTEEVGVLLVDGALARLDQRRHDLATESARIQELLDAEDAHLDEVRREAQRVAAHVLAAMRRHAEQLLIELRDLLVRIEADLPGQVDGVGDLDLARRALPHWLQHILDQGLDRGLSTWRTAVLADLAELDVDEQDAARAELLIPALHPPPFGQRTGWGRRIALTAALGGAALLAASGLWLPSLLAVGGGLAWSGFGASSEREGSRDALIEGARGALRQLGEQAEAVLNDQLGLLQTELEELDEERHAEAEAERAAFRAELEATAAQLARVDRTLEQTAATLESAR